MLFSVSSYRLIKHHQYYDDDRVCINLSRFDDSDVCIDGSRKVSEKNVD